MKKISCSNYGYDCKFEIIDNDLELIEKYQKHCIDEHGVEHSIEGLTQLLLRIKNWKQDNIDFNSLIVNIW